MVSLFGRVVDGVLSVAAFCWVRRGSAYEVAGAVCAGTAAYLAFGAAAAWSVVAVALILKSLTVEGPA